MPLATGGGKYEKQCEALLRETGAEFAMVLVGHQHPDKSGFSCALTPKGVGKVPAIIRVLREAAQQFENEWRSHH